MSSSECRSGYLGVLDVLLCLVSVRDDWFLIFSFLYSYFFVLSVLFLFLRFFFFFVFFFFFQAEDGIRDHCVTGVQTCALPICWTVPPGRGRSPNGVPRPRLSVYHTCTGTRLSSPGVWPTNPRHGRAPGTTNSWVYAVVLRGNSATLSGTPGSSDSLPAS